MQGVQKSRIKKPGELTFKITAVLLVLSGIFEMASLTTQVPLLGHVITMPAILWYHYFYIFLFVAVGIGTWLARIWGYYLLQFTCVVYTLDRLQASLYPQAIREYLMSELASVKMQLAGLPIDISILEQPDFIKQIIWLMQLMSFLIAACWAGFAVWTYWRRAYFGIAVSTNN